MIPTLDLGNLVDDTYTGSWETILTANFFTSEDTFEPADVVLPISSRRSAENAPSGFVVPGSRALNNLILPQNANKAVFSISACGQAAEEFWWSNVLTSDTHVFGNESVLYGHSPFRELRLLIDGQVAGVAWPFPVIFTGGVVPGFWRPVVGIDAFDLKEDEIDISPFLPLLSDGQQHAFEIQVMGINDDGHGNGNLTIAIESNWVVTGKIFVWLDHNVNTTTGTLPTISAPEPSIVLHSVINRSPNLTVNSLDYSIVATRSIRIESTLNTPAGPKSVSWQQSLTFSNSGTLSNQGNDQIMRQTTTGVNKASSSSYTRRFEYPLWVTSSYNAPTGGNVSIDAKMSRGKNVQQHGDLAFLNEWRSFDYGRLKSTSNDASTIQGSKVNNWQNGTATYRSVPAEKRSYGSGTTEQLYALGSIDDEAITVVQDGLNAVGAPSNHPVQNLYRRHILASNDSIVYDDEMIGHELAKSKIAATSPKPINGALHEYAWRDIRGLLRSGHRK